MALESFHDLLQRLKDLHEREIEGWQEKVLELTNQKCCDSKRMEELFNKNQLLREQQRLLTENIKQLENRLRAGLCDRCTVTQDVAKRRQQEYESSQIQSLQHITVLVSEMNALKKENKRLQDEIKNLQRVLEGQNSQGPLAHASEVSPSPDPPLSAMAFIAAMNPKNQPQGGATPGLTVVKSDPDHNSSCAIEEKLPPYRKSQNWNGNERQTPHKPHVTIPMSPGSRPEQHSVRGPVMGEKRVRSVDSGDPQLPPSSPSPLFFLKNLPYSSSTTSSPPGMGDEKPGRNILHAPLPYRPRPIKTARLSLPWPLPEQADWVTLAPLCSVGGGVGLQPAPPVQETRVLVPGREPNPSQSGKGSMQLNWADRGAPQPQGATLPVRRTMSAEQVERKENVEEKEVAPIWWGSEGRKMERIFGENLREGDTEAPLDLSDPGKSKPCVQQQQVLVSSPNLQECRTQEEEQACGRMDTSPLTSAGSTSSSSPPVHSSPSSACSHSSPQLEYGQHPQQQDTLEKDESLEDKADSSHECSGSTEQKKVPVLTISLHPVVVLEALKPGSGGKTLCDGEMTLDIPPEVKLEGESENVLSSSYDRSQNGRRKTRGQFTVREASLRTRSPKDRRVKMSPGQQIRAHSDLEQS
ncbi:hypothetical protein AGOR_G00137920 [Albula goreensis]|uniref:DNA endonuclease Ctp1 N-terminal domain-containing protein n=1 Tax=Albula goreensis TaxID=1534307 RepID=A0A8T3DED2_9TELE|nr:hypothetical protein AGOR_G00137920 [Albula goreensis]